MDDRHARFDRQAARGHREGRRARLVGRDSVHADRAHRRSVRRRARDQGIQRRRNRRQRPPDGRRPLRVPSHDLEHERRSPAGTGRSCRRPGRSPLAWPVHEVGRNADLFDPRSAKLLKAGSSIVSDSIHLHSNGRDTKAHLEIGFKFMPKDYKPIYTPGARRARQRRRHRHQGDDGGSAAARVRGAAGEHEDRLLRAAPPRAGSADVSRSDLGLQHPDAELRRLRPQLGARLHAIRTTTRRCCPRARSCTSSAT